MKKITALFFGLATLAFHADAQTAPAANPARSPLVLGHSERIHSALLGEQRTLNIYLPDGYSAQADTTYPVIYLLDGAADEDFIHIAGAVQFASFPWVKRLPPSILVGIANTDRKRDMTFKTSAGFE